MHLNLWKTMRLIGLTGWSIYKLDLLQLSKHVLVLEILMRNNPWRLLSDDWSATTVLTTFLHRLSDQHALFNGHEVLLLKLQFSAARISSRNRMIGYLLCSICLSFFKKKIVWHTHATWQDSLKRMSATVDITDFFLSSFSLRSFHLLSVWHANCIKIRLCHHSNN